MESTMIKILYNYGLIDLDSLDADDIDTVSVAAALSRIHRFSGNFDSMSVAQHALCVSQLVEHMDGTPLQQMAGLHHDDAEAFLGDVPSPVKAHCPGYQDLEMVVNHAISEKYGIDMYDELVKEADDIMGCRELHHHLDMNPLMPRFHIKLPKRYMELRVNQTALVAWPEKTTLARYIERHDALMVDIVKDYSDDILSKDGDAVAIPGSEGNGCLN